MEIEVINVLFVGDEAQTYMNLIVQQANNDLSYGGVAVSI
jgi:hypothetical protein